MAVPYIGVYYPLWLLVREVQSNDIKDIFEWTVLRSVSSQTWQRKQVNVCSVGYLKSKCTLA